MPPKSAPPAKAARKKAAPKRPKTLKIGMVGLGRMGAGMTARIRKMGHEVVGFDQNPAVSDVKSLAELVKALPKPRVVWLMVPSGAITEATIKQVSALLSEGDILIDGGNSWYKDSVRRGKALARKKGIHFVDSGTSGGIWGLENGFCLMVGGPKEAVEYIEPIMAALAPPDGYAHVGASGAGHYAKMVHNGIEYGMLQAYAEGFDLLQAADYGYDLQQLSTLWNHGSVVRSWLLELAERAFERDPKLESLKGYVDDSGEGRWTVIEGVERGVNVNVLAASLFSRFTSREENPFAMRVIAALRNEFGGHAVQAK